MHDTAARACGSAPRADRFLCAWLASFSVGAVVGLAAVRVSARSMSEGFPDLCRAAFAGGRFPLWPMLAGVTFFFLLIVLCSQLPGGGLWVRLLTGAKAFCTAYVYGVFYLVRSVSGLGAALLPLAVHTVLSLPALYSLSFHCLRFRLWGRGLHWFRYRTLPPALLYAYLLALTAVMSVLRSAG